MSTQLRRSLRHRSANLEEDTAVHALDHAKKGASKPSMKQAPSSDSFPTTATIGRKKGGKDPKAEDHTDENLAVIHEERIEEADIEMNEKKPTRPQRKRGVANAEKEEHDQSGWRERVGERVHSFLLPDEEEAVAPPKKTTKSAPPMSESRRAPRRKMGSAVRKEEEEGVGATTPLAPPSIGRPRRSAVKKITVEKYEDLLSGSASSSDASSSESEVDDSDLEKEIKRAKRRKTTGTAKGAKKQAVESSSDSMSDGEEEEEDEEGESDDEEPLDVDEPVTKKGRGRGGAGGGGGKGGGWKGRSNGGGKTKGGQKRPKADESGLPVQILHEKEYDVDYEEMVEWEAKSVKMVKDLRELERDRANGGAIMESVGEFIERLLKGGRMTEMDEKESIRVTHAHEAELAELNRKKHLTVAQRVKEQVEKEKQRVEEEDKEEKSDESEEEDEWEEMEPVDGEDKDTNGGVEVTIETRKKLIAPWKAKWIRQEVNREARQRCENIHKAHLVSYMAHLRALMARATREGGDEGGVSLTARALSLLPAHLLQRDEPRKKGAKKAKGLDKEELVDKMIEWWRKDWKKLSKKEAENLKELSELERMGELMEKLQFESSRDASVLFLSLVAHLAIPLRLVARCDVVTKKPKENSPPVKKGAAAAKGKKGVEKKEDGGSKKDEKVEYWCELWNDEKKTWRVFDPFTASKIVDGEKKSKKLKKGKDEDVKEEEGIPHSECLHSCMEKDGAVLYFLAVDGEFSIRDVSFRYLHEKDSISREMRGRRANDEWLEELWKNKAWAASGDRAKAEDAEWQLRMERMPLPTVVAGFKDHPLYVLGKDVLKMQMIFPYDTKPIGDIRGNEIFPRKFLRQINTAKWYEKMGRQIKKDEPPCGEKLAVNPMTGDTGAQGLYGYWQTDPWDGGEVVEGRIPRNEYGNAYMYQPSMVPRGCIYLVPDSIQRVATEMGKDFVTAVIAWYYKGGNTIPLIRGAVFIKDDLPELIGGWRSSYQRWKDEERKMRRERSLGRWKKFIKGMMRLASMKKEFAPIENKKKKGTQTLDDDETMGEERRCWPQKKYGAAIFDDS